MAKLVKTVAAGAAVVALAATGIGAVAFPAFAGSLSIFGISTAALGAISTGQARAGPLRRRRRRHP
ncbi:hypothetical protein NZL82_15550 [Sphingomonas sanguinis]|uniref:hypothetical protein n=1 Tax=Sphingomonas sp. LC-1 TaxID=3110957 RepID=UPI0021BB902E|nr:hypothetical protein [Sphingomonas sp. LC-1]MCT8003291.1 hypothetical protein [Sphingomonas sp. LC-1]